MRHSISWGQRLKRPCLHKILGGSEVFTTAMLESQWLVSSWPSRLLRSYNLGYTSFDCSNFLLVFTLNGTQSDHTVFIFSKSISEEQTESLIQFYLPFISIAKFQTITQCFDSKEHYQKNKYFKF